MVVEYLLLLLISVMIILAPFITGKGPVTMFHQNGAKLAEGLVSPRLETGKGFCEKVNNSGFACRWQ